jgi:hypothetical protein
MLAQAEARRTLEAVREVRRLAALFKRVYPLVADQAGTEGLQAQLEREVFGLARQGDPKAG